MKDQTKFQGLSDEIIALLAQHEGLVKDSEFLADKDQQLQLRNNAATKESFTKRQTKVTFMGVMKAGKSTCLTACVGYQLFPVRTLPMTTLSTAVEHNPHLTEPVMAIPEDLFLKANSIIARFVELQQDAAPVEVAEFVKNLEKVNFRIQQQVTGIEAVHETLSLLNDLVRVSSNAFVKRQLGETLVEDIMDCFTGLNSFPKIEVNFPTANNIRDEGSGVLVLIDTPGPDEVKLHNSLYDINARTLMDSDAICLVLNSKALGNGSEDELLRMVRDCELDKIYVIINQVDDPAANEAITRACKTNILDFNARTQAEDSSAKDSSLRQLVIPDDHIFPMSAMQATAWSMLNQYLAEHGEDAELPPATDPAWRQLYQIVLGPTWERRLKRLTLQDLQEDCTYLFQSCGFSTFLETVVHEALAKAGYRSAVDTLLKIKMWVQLLKKRIQVHISLMDSDPDMLTKTAIRDRLQRATVKLEALREVGIHLESKALDRLRHKWAESSSKVKSALQHHIAGGDTGGWYIPFWTVKPKKYFGEKVFSARSPDALFAKVQPILDELNAHVAAATRSLLEDFVQKTYLPEMKALVELFNSTVVAEMVRVVCAEFRQYPIQFAEPEKFEIDEKEMKSRLARVALPTSRSFEVKETKRAWWWFFALASWEETVKRTVFELEPDELCRTSQAQIVNIFAEVNAVVDKRMDTVVHSLFRPTFDAAQQAVDDVTSDLLRAEEQLRHSKSENEHHKVRARQFLMKLDELDASQRRLRDQLHDWQQAC